MIVPFFLELMSYLFFHHRSSKAPKNIYQTENISVLKNLEHFLVEMSGGSALFYKAIIN